MMPIAPRIVDRDDRWITLRNRVQIKILRFRSEVRRPLWSTSVNVQTYIVGRPGLDPGTLGLKGTFHRLFCVGLVAHVFCFQENVLFCVGLVSWCCRNMRPKMRPVEIPKRFLQRNRPRYS